MEEGINSEDLGLCTYCGGDENCLLYHSNGDCNQNICVDFNTGHFTGDVVDGLNIVFPDVAGTDEEINKKL